MATDEKQLNRDGLSTQDDRGDDAGGLWRSAGSVAKTASVTTSVVGGAIGVALVLAVLFTLVL